MIRLHLTAEGVKDTFDLPLPAVPAEVDKAYAWFNKAGVETGQIRIAGMTSPVYSLSQYITRANVGSAEDMEKLNKLAKSVYRMHSPALRLFTCALDAESINGLDDVLHLADSLGNYELIEGVTSDRELGGWLVENGQLDVDFPENVRPYLDYAGIGAAYYAEHGGAYTPAGYVKRRESSQEQAARTRPTLITVYMHTLEVPGTPSKTCCLQLPATDSELEEAKRKMDVDSFANAFISKIEFGKPYLEELIPQDCFCVEDANELALGMEQMLQDDGEFMKYLSVLSVEQPETLISALHFAMNIDDYERVPDDLDDYGKQVLRRAGVDDEILDTIDGYMDFAKLGEDSMEEDGVRRTDFGLVRRLSTPFPEMEIGQTMV